MTAKNVGAMVVLNDEGGVAGIFSERDLLTRVVAQKLDAESTKVAEVMTSHPWCVDTSMTVAEAMQLATDQRVRHLPLTSGNRLEGFISAGDLMASALEMKESEIRGLSTKLKRHNSLIAILVGLAVVIVLGIVATGD